MTREEIASKSQEEQVTVILDALRENCELEAELKALREAVGNADVQIVELTNCEHGPSPDYRWGCEVALRRLREAVKPYMGETADGGGDA